MNANTKMFETTKIAIIFCLMNTISIYASESTNFTLQQDTIVSSTIQTNSQNFSLTPGILGEPFGGSTESVNFKTYSGYTLDVTSSYTQTRYINITGTIGDLSADAIWAQDLEGKKDGAINSNTFTIENILIQEGENIIPITCVDKVGNNTSKNLTVYFDPIAPSLPQANIISLTQNSLENISGQKEQYASLWVNDIEIISANYPIDDYSLQHNSESWNSQISLTEGKKTLQIYSIDRAGNKSAVLTAEVILDAVAGNIQITEPQDGDFKSQQYITVKGTYQEDDPYIEVNGIKATLEDETHFVAENVPLQEGNNIVQAVLTSLLNNTNQNNINVVLDTIGPKIMSYNPSQSVKCFGGEKIALSLEIYDEFYQWHKIGIYLDGVEIESRTVNFGETLELEDYTIPEDSFGRKILQFIVTDSAGSSDSADESVFVLKKALLP